MARSVDLDRFFLATRGRGGVYEALPPGVRITFVLNGDGGGVWTVSRDVHGDVDVVRRDADRPDCRLRCSVEDFLGLARGELNVRKAFFERRIDVAGDVGLVWRLQKILVAQNER